MDLEYYAWRRFAKVLPLVALLLVIYVPAVRDWVTQMRVERVMDVLAWFNALFNAHVLPSLIDAVTPDTIPRRP